MNRESLRLFLLQMLGVIATTPHICHLYTISRQFAPIIPPCVSYILETVSLGSALIFNLHHCTWVGTTIWLFCLLFPCGLIVTLCSQPLSNQYYTKQRDLRISSANKKCQNVIILVCSFINYLMLGYLQKCNHVV